MFAEMLTGVVKGGLPDELPRDPMAVVVEWLEDARRSGAYEDPNAMTLATCTAEGFPSARIVLCKAIDETRVVVYTNYEGRKGREIVANPRVACVFHWPHANRQARIEGVAIRGDDAESDAYFASRPVLSKLGAWASRQSAVMESRSSLVDAVGSVTARFAKELAMHPSGSTIPRPPFWGGFQVLPTAVELWCGAKGGRLHDRARWTRARVGGAEGGAITPREGWGAWSGVRLFP
jgi:pyridoxamine 5'-phosphate oxidase